MHDLVPKAVRIAVLVNPANSPTTEATLRDIPEAARALGLQIQVLHASTSREIETAFATLVRDRADALFVAPDGFFTSRRVQFATLAARHAIPAAYSNRSYPEVGGLMSYGTDTLDYYRQVGVYTGQILKGAKPAEMPVLQSTKWEFVINMQTARALGLEVPNSSAIARRRGDRMRRREFITLLGGRRRLAAGGARAAAGADAAHWCIHDFAADDAEGQARLGHSCRGCNNLAGPSGSNVQIDVRWSAGDPERGRRDAAELVALAPDVILATGGATVGPLLQATRTVPIVFMLSPRSGRRRLR